ncbi:hypothetical protein [Brassicibacter mesophilus]|uniref:hypothetical protein n=1 Tax=Brassicibacter mesophilus TaxID=745119 RepID=UPI003D22BDB9
MNTLMHEIKMTIAKIKNLEKNKQTNNAEIIETEVSNERNKLNELIKIAKHEHLKANCIEMIRG